MRAALLILWSSLAAADDLHIRMQRPPLLIGDGRTAVTLLFDTPPELPSLTLQADAGRVGASRVTPSGYAVEYVAPRVASPRDVHVAVVVGGVLSSSSLVLRVEPAPLSATEISSRGRLGLRAPGRLVLGPATLPSTVSLAAPARLFVNAGSFGELTQKGARWQAEYRPPPTRFPQVALMAALAGDSLEWLALPLYGLGRVETRTKPGAELLLLVGDTLFGPFRADDKGFAATVVAAPPGVRSGRTRAVDALGNAKDTPFDLGTPPFNRLLAVCANGRLHVLVVDGAAQPSLADEPLRATVAAGTLSPLERVAPGHFVARWQPGLGSAEARVALAGEPASSGRCTLEPRPAAPTSIELALGRDRYVAGSGRLPVSARLHPPGAGRVTLSVDFGQLEDIREEAGATVANWRLPASLEGRRQALLLAHFAALDAQAALPLLPGPVAHLSVEPPRRFLSSDGKSRMAVAVRAEDAHGNPTSPAGAIATLGGRGFAVGDDGRVEVRAPALSHGGTQALSVVHPDGAAAALPLRFGQPLHASAMTLRLGWLGNFGKLSAPYLAVAADYRPPWLGRAFSVGLGAGFYQSAWQGGGVQQTVRGFPVEVRVAGRLPLGRLGLTLGVGGGLVVSDVDSSSPTLVSDHSTALLGLFEAFAAADVDVRLGRLLVELDFLYAPRSSGTVTGNFGGLAPTLGYRVDL